MTDIVDYAMPCMLAEKALKELHLAMLENDFDKATVEGTKAMIEIADALRAIEEMKEKARK